MKVILLRLSGDQAEAHDALRSLYPDALIEEIPRREVEEGSHARRLARLRERRPNLFAVATEQLAWQRGQNHLLLFGALAGAERTLIFDKYGALREETRARILTNA
ncbi:MAG: hypothetical protein H0X14_12095, partial [Acidobacteria bacterium]|nr:hypothetical protein [Acidobacteriota bacterium]